VVRAPIMGAMSIQSDNPEHGFQFPGIFEVSAMGAAEADLHLVVPMVLEALGLTIYRDRLRVKPSAKGNYVSVTLVFEAHSREDYDAAHGALRDQPLRGRACGRQAAQPSRSE